MRQKSLRRCLRSAQFPSFLLRKFRDNIAQQLRFGHSSTKFAKATAFAH